MGRRIDWSFVDFSRPDAENAARLKCSPGAVKKARLARGKLRPANWRWRSRAGVDWSTQPLGSDPDHVIARRLGVHTQTVERARMRAGIRACATMTLPLEVPLDLWAALKKRHPKTPTRDAVIVELRAALRRSS